MDTERKKTGNCRLTWVIAAGCIFLSSCAGESGGEVKAEEKPEVSSPSPTDPPPVAPPQIDMASVKTGEVYQTVCAACHGANGEGNKQILSPAIAGLPKWYVKEQTGKFRTGLRGAHPKDTLGQMMRTIALALTPEQLEEAAAFVEKLPEGKTEQHGDKASVDRGRKIFANECMQCHRFNGRGEVVFHSAPLTTLDRDYLIRQLKKYRNGWRGNDKSDFYGHKMVVVGGTLSDQSIEDVVNFIGALAHGDDPRSEMEF